MSGRSLLDTNIVIALFARDQAVTEELAEAEEVFVPSIILGELLNTVVFYLAFGVELL